MNLSFWVEGEEFRVKMEEAGTGLWRVSLNDRAYAVSAEFINPDEILLNVDGRVFNVTVNSNGFSHSVIVNGQAFVVEKRASDRPQGLERGGRRKKDIAVSMPGRVVQVLAVEGQDVVEGQPVMILEAMKMQNEIKAPRAGVLKRLNVRAGEAVEAGAVLFTVE